MGSEMEKEHIFMEMGGNMLENGKIISLNDSFMSFFVNFIYKLFDFHRFHGRGQLVFPNGQVYKCRYEHGRVASKVSIDYPNGDRYVGEVKGVLIHGKGKYTSKSKDYEYDGEWKNQQHEGKGTMRLYDKDHRVIEEYTGDWVQNRRQGHGRFSRLDGFVYEGEWKADRV